LVSSPAKSGKPLAGIVAEPPLAMAKGRIAKLLFFPWVDLQSKGKVLNP
jgi:hypothetical protein